MYAVVEVGGRQWKVEPGSRIDINRVATAVGAQHTVERVLLAHDGQTVQVGRPYVAGAQVICEVVEHRRGPKVISYHFRRRENWRKTVGHRQSLTRLLVRDIVVPGVAVEPAVAATEQPRAAQRATAKPRASKKSQNPA